MKKQYDCIVIGGGLSGIVSAIELTKANISCCIIEANQRIGKKILASGNGKCNILNSNLSKDNYNNSFVENALKKYSVDDLVNYYNSLGLLLRLNEDKYYPYSESANSVLNVLLAKLKELKIDVFENEKVLSITKTNLFNVKTANNLYLSNKVILATGSNASFGVASYALAGDLGHKCTKLKQSLVPIKISQKLGANGVRAKVNASLYINDKFVMKEDGEVLFKDEYLSGILAFRLSSHIARSMVRGEFKSAKVYLDFIPSIKEEDLNKFISESKLEDPLVGIVHKAIAQNVMNKSNKANALKNFELDVVGLGPIDNAQVMSGGLDIKSFNSDTFESKITKGFYAIGEVLDVDGECGGFNLSFALLSALCATKSIIGKKC